ncbi:hypothetical protein [Larkinella sp. C7]|jgi:hypothetical protein|uniref:hypothetical protein n=1 Tax=Larkinella sp. C7 TaxID=2576607 RepID=UPI001111308B|nr:hypothetical protein [Larkinella sp. C7]
MENTVEDYIDVNERVKELNCERPTTFCFLPENFENASSINEFVYNENTITFRKLFKKFNIKEDKLEDLSSQFRQRRSNDLYTPMIFIGYSILSQNPELISEGLNVLSNYITDLFKGTIGKKEVTVEFVIESKTKENFKKVTFKGDPESLKYFDKILKSFKDV